MFGRGKRKEEEGSALKTAVKTAVGGKVAKDILTSDEEEKDGGKGKFVALALAGLGAAGFWMKKRRQRELDEALWEEPRAL